MDICAVGNRLLLKPIPPPYKPKKDYQKFGEVVAVGEESYGFLDIGQVAIYHDGEVIAFDHEGEDLVLVEDVDILAVIGDFPEGEDFDEDDNVNIDF